MADRQSMLPILYIGLSDNSRETVSKGFLDKLRTFYERNRLENLFLAKELHKVTKLLEANNIPAVPYKGPILGKILHGNYSIRHAGDLDILVAPSNLLNAAELLLSVGYSTNPKLSGTQMFAYQRYSNGHHISFSKPDSGLNVELHWNIAPKHIVSNVIFEEIIYKAIAEDGDNGVRLLAQDDLVLMLNVHLRNHIWNHLDLLFDMATLVKKSEAIDLDKLYSRAAQIGGTSSLMVTLHIIKTLFCIGFKHDGLNSTSKDKELEQFSSQMIKQLFSDQTRNSEDFNFEGLLIHSKAIRGTRARLRNMGEIVFRPNLWDVLTTDLPPWLNWVYFVIRPFRLLRKYGFKLIRYGSKLLGALSAP